MLLSSDQQQGQSETAVSPAKIIIRGASKTFTRSRSSSSIEALSKVSLDIADNTFVTLVGPSGCGKTTLLRLINGLVEPDSGEVLVSGKTPQPGPNMGFVFQSFRLIPWTTVRRNIAFGLMALAAFSVYLTHASCPDRGVVFALSMHSQTLRVVVTR